MSTQAYEELRAARQAPDNVNRSGLKPLGVAVLVEPYEPEIKASRLHLPPTVAERSSMVETRAIVVAIGPSAWHDEMQPRAKVGDKVFITKLAGVMAVGPLDGKTYRLVNDRDIFCQITSEG